MRNFNRYLPLDAPPPNTYCSRGPQKKNPQKNKFNLKTLKKDACTSLNDVEHFLNNFSDFLKYIKLINLLK